MENFGFDLEMKDIEEAKNSLKNSNEKNVEEEEDKDEDEIELEANNYVGVLIQKARTKIIGLITQRQRKLNLLQIALFLILYNIYLIYSIVYTRQQNLDFDFCNGIGFLLIISGLVYTSLTYYFIKAKFKERISEISKPIIVQIRSKLDNKYTQLIIFLVSFFALMIFLIIDAWEDKTRLRSLGGIPILVIFAILISKHPGHIIWRQVICGIAFQFIFGLIILRTGTGKNMFNCLSLKAKTFLSFSTDGSDFIYGYLSSGYSGKKSENHTSPIRETGESSLFLEPIFAFRALSIIFYVNFFISIFFHLGIMQWICVKLGWCLQVIIGTTAAESMNAAANIFIGQTEAPLLIKPYLKKMTRSEIHAVMSSGFSTIAGTVLGAYISFGIDPSYLISASVMAAPASLAFSKIIYPETRVSKTTSKSIKLDKVEKTASNLLDAASQGSIQGGFLVASIIANIIGFISFIAFVNSIVTWLGSLIGIPYLSFEWILGKVFIPFAYLIGISYDEVGDVGLLLGLKTVLNEFIAYKKLKELHLSERSTAIATYALCSFANFSSIGIQIGGFSTLVPEKRRDITKTVIRSFITGGLVSLLNACVAGSLIGNSPMDIQEPFSMTTHYDDNIMTTTENIYRS